MLILLSEALLGNQVFTWSPYITSSHQWVKLSIAQNGTSWKHAPPCMMQSKLYNVTHVIFLPKVFNLNLQMRKQSEKNLNFGMFYNKMTWIFQKCQCYDIQNIVGDCARLKETKGTSKLHTGASLVAQWLRVCLPMQGTRIRALDREDPTCRRAAEPVSHTSWTCASGACAPQRERPRWWEAGAPRWRVAPACRNWRKPSHRNEKTQHSQK